MSLHFFLILIVLGASVFFAAANWSVIMAPTALSLGFTAIEAPLGLILIGLIALLSLLFLAYVVYLQSSALLETRRHSRDLQGQRELADQAESSRFMQLHSFLEAELPKLKAQQEDTNARFLARLEQLEREWRLTLEQSGNTLAAYIGEVDDKLEKMLCRMDSKQTV